MSDPAASQMMGVDEVCRFFGGNEKPLHPSTLYKGIRRGVFPEPVRLSKKMSRWRREDCVAAMKAIVASQREEQ